jgi:hypothetical protein
MVESQAYYLSYMLYHLQHLISTSRAKSAEARAYELRFHSRTKRILLSEGSLRFCMRHHSSKTAPIFRGSSGKRVEEIGKRLILRHTNPHLRQISAREREVTQATDQFSSRMLPES